MQPPWREFSGRMAYEGAPHAGVEPLSAALDPLALAGLIERNLHVLNAVGALEERRVESADDDSPTMQELLRLDSKLNVLMAIVNRLLAPVAQLPPRQPLRFNAFGASLAASSLGTLGDGQPCLLRLHFDACLALPLELFGHRGGTGEDGQALIVFEAIGETVGEGLERFVFRHHRRKVAEARQIAT